LQPTGAVPLQEELAPKTFHRIYLEEDSSDWIDNILLENTFRKLSSSFFGLRVFQELKEAESWVNVQVQAHEGAEAEILKLGMPVEQL